ncbi:MAG: hypothetical protein JNJ41_04210 [Bacteroidia bacterium]|nr:hypothetical protein [Bacteroidia bacterium]
MYRLLIIAILFVSFAMNGQTKTKTKTKTKVAKVDSTGAEIEEEKTPEELLELTLPLETEIDPMTGKKVFYKERKLRNDSLRNALRIEQRKKKMSFWVKTTYPNPKLKTKQPPIQLCINIANKDTNLTYCVNDSICKDPEIKKVVYEKVVGDTTYMLIFIQAFTKSKSDGGVCNAGKEQKLYFVRWHPKTNVAKWKLKNINSCIKTITNMTKEKITDWDKTSILTVSYHRGSNFYDIKFDPQKPQLGFQTDAAGGASGE